LRIFLWFVVVDEGAVDGGWGFVVGFLELVELAEGSVEHALEAILGAHEAVELVVGAVVGVYAVGSGEVLCRGAFGVDAVEIRVGGLQAAEAPGEADGPVDEVEFGEGLGGVGFDPGFAEAEDGVGVFVGEEGGGGEAGVGGGVEGGFGFAFWGSGAGGALGVGAVGG
jgi:hypothetical protein